MATADVIRHLVALPFLLLGLVLVRWPAGVAELFGNAFGDLGAKDHRSAYVSRAGVVLVRIVGILLTLISAYWMIVGTG